MSFKIGGPRRTFDANNVVEHTSHGGWFATVLSALALVISGLSYYETTLKSADLSVFVPPMIHYARDMDGDVFNVPITIANDGARSGTVLALELEVENLQADAPKKSARFYSAYLGEYATSDAVPNRSFAPLSIPGHGTFTETVRFYPMSTKTKPYVVADKGDYRFTLKLMTATPDHTDQAKATAIAPLVFQMNLPYISQQHLEYRHGTIAMTNANWQAAAASGGQTQNSARDADASEGSTAPGDAIHEDNAPPAVQDQSQRPAQDPR